MEKITAKWKTIVFLLFIFAHPLLSVSQSIPVEDFKTTPTLAWKFKSNKPFISSPIIDGETVYVGCLDSALYALNINTGSQKWKFKTNGPIRSTVCVNENAVYLISGDGNFYSLDKLSGKTVWIFKTGGDTPSDLFDYFQSTPVVNNSVIYFGSGDGNIYALNATDGKLKWNYKTGGAVHAAPVINNSKLYVGSFDGYTYALNMTDGSLAWKFKSAGHDYFPKGEMQFSPSVAYGRVFTGGRDYNIYALDAKKGYSHWNREFPEGWVTTITPSFKNDTTIYVATSDPLVLIKENAITGEEIWKTNLHTNVFGWVTFSQTMGYVGTMIGKVYGLDLKTGKIQWMFSTDSYKANYSKYFKPDDSFRDDISSILKTDEAFLNALNDVGAIYSTPAITNNFIIFSSMEGAVYCLKKSK